MTPPLPPGDAAAPAAGPDPELVGALTARLDAESLPRLGRSLAVYPVRTGDCGGCALELAMLETAAASLVPYGISVQDSPVGADVMLVTGAMTRCLAAPVREALRHLSRPFWVVAIGDCAIDGGPFAGSAAVAGGTAAAVLVDLAIPGCPPRPADIVAGLRTLLAVNG